MGENDLIAIAEADLQMAELAITTTNDELMQNMAAYHVQQAIEKVLKQLLISKRGFGSNDHDLERLLVDLKQVGLDAPDWIGVNSYEISKWATTIRYNSNFKTNRENILHFIEKTKEWISDIKKNLV